MPQVDEFKGVEEVKLEDEGDAGVQEDVQLSKSQLKSAKAARGKAVKKWIKDNGFVKSKGAGEPKELKQLRAMDPALFLDSDKKASTSSRKHVEQPPVNTDTALFEAVFAQNNLVNWHKGEVEISGDSGEVLALKLLLKEPFQLLELGQRTYCENQEVHQGGSKDAVGQLIYHC